jgi:putative membrane protein
MLGFEWLRPAAFLGSILYAIVGVLLFWIAFVLVDKLTPYDLWQELVEKQNVALGLVVAATSLGICLIVAAAIH